MSRVRQTKISSPSNPPANTEELYYDTAGPGYLTPPALCSRNESGVIAMLGHYATLDYRFVGLQTFTATGAGTYTPTSGVRAIFVECVGGGGGSGNALVTSSNSSVSAGGGGGGYACGFVAAISATVPFVVGVGGLAGSAGAAGGNGADSTFNATTVVGKAGTGGGAGTTAGTTGHSVGGAGGVAGTAGTGGFTSVGSDGGDGVALSATQGWCGSGGASMFGGSTKETAVAVATITAGVVGKVYGGGAAGAANIGTNASPAAGAAGGNGIIRVWEYA